MKQKQSMPDRKLAAMETISETIKLSSDILAKAPILVVIGQTELSIENYRGIIEYTGDLLRIQTKTGKIRIEGKNLVIRNYSEDAMKVSGHISLISYS